MQRDRLLATLKGLMQAQGITYKKAAQALGLSEVSIKRLFSEKNCSLSRLEKLCELVDTDLASLVHLAESSQPQLSQLSVEQEQQLVDDPGLLLVAVCIINHWSFDDILSQYEFDTAKLTGCFTRLDRMGIIELLPANRYRLKISRVFNWLPCGPIQQFFIQSILSAYLCSGIRDEGSHFRFVWGMLAPESVDELRRKIQRLLDEYLQIVEQDVRIAVDKKLSSSLLVMFREDWEPENFRRYRRESHSR